MHRPAGAVGAGSAVGRRRRTGTAFSATGFRRAAGRRATRADAAGNGVDRWSRHRQDDDRGPAARAPGAGRASGPAAHRAGGADRKSCRPAAGGRLCRGGRTRCRRPGAAQRAASRHAAPVARRASRQRLAVQAPPRQPVAHDVVVVDETSMVSLTVMARLLEAVRPDTRLLLVGDPDQLTSVQAGAVLADLVDGLTGHPSIKIAALHTTHRFGVAIGGLAEAIRSGDADQVLTLLRAGDAAIEFIEDAEPAAALRPALVGHALKVRACALLGAGPEGLAAMDEHRLLCAHRDGPYGVRHWNRQVERWITDETGQATWSPWYPGRPLLVTANDYALGIYNGDTGLVAAGPDGVQVYIAGATGTQRFSPSRIADVETMYALTIHKSQGSQADEVTVILPPADSRLLTRELFYTAVTRAKQKVRIVGSADEVRAAVQRQALRASGLRDRLRAGT
ncbi:exodeoxyribonuclease V subunit alpha [Mycolicibacterium phocaicum]|uniref:exodeoxyribonuclease V subunit alpha n=1 Tax=Mycolicibacterium phocaicum TaxID=319706 RepID=UPI002E2EBCF9|nr:exodeoxyribonuclease V subunit alpha [Mycolicibacterium phocaicum]